MNFSTVIIIILTLSLFFSLYFLYKVYNEKKVLISKNSKLQSRIDLITQEIEDIDLIGRKGLHIVPLQGINDKEKNYFDATYEVEIIGSSKSKFKIKALSYTIDKSYAINSSSIMGYINDRNNWVKKSDVEIITMTDDSAIRESKMKKILDN